MRPPVRASVRRRLPGALALVAAAFALVVVSTVSGCAQLESAGRDPVTLNYRIDDVRVVRLNGGYLKLVQGSPTSLSIDTQARMLPWIVNQRPQGDTLELGLPDDSDLRGLLAPSVIPTDAPLVFTLVTPDLKRIELGEGTVRSDGYEGELLELDANMGEATLYDTRVQEWVCTMAGGKARVVITGRAPIQRVTNSSGSHYDDRGLKGFGDD